MGPHGINRSVHRIAFSDCENGLGIKVIGGFKEQTGEEYGIYVKRVLHRGVAANDGRLQAGDLILEVNGEDLAGVTNDRAVDILRTASASSHMSLLITRDEESRREFAELMEKYESHSNAGSARSSPTPHSSGETPPPPGPVLHRPAGEGRVDSRIAHVAAPAPAHSVPRTARPSPRHQPWQRQRQQGGSRWGNRHPCTLNPDPWTSTPEPRPRLLNLDPDP
ncbi:discs large homolog 1-like protein [Amblyraja radiata]|uniref:discs large homolog 1-like protein n=1 Tax=Amblyraja radiata TaxID=386614 RepID=UPI0014033FF6|nr:discs large homolog 1-like protein [Amblyraja radiata]